jgi:hypothetical protein
VLSRSQSLNKNSSKLNSTLASSEENFKAFCILFTSNLYANNSFTLPSRECIHCSCWNSSSPLFVFVHCMLLNINFTMKIIKNASLAISREHKKTTFHWMLHSHLLWVEHVCIYGMVWLMCIYIYACFVAVSEKSIIYILRLWNWSATLYNSLYLPKGFGKHPSTYTRHSSKTSTHIWGRRDLLLKIKISLFLVREKFPTRAIFSCHLLNFGIKCKVARWRSICGVNSRFSHEGKSFSILKAKEGREKKSWEIFWLEEKFEKK